MCERCSECNEHCDGQLVDFGIGPGEAWGRPFNDVNEQWVSQCCEAPILDGAGFPVEMPERGEDEDG
jgi:hypothetical protein